MNDSKTTPMIKQYLAIKAQYADTILFYRMGDFYEMFFEDAEVASGVLEIALTSRNKNDETPIPMCGVPARAAQGYVARLIERGYKVAICEQTEDPADAKGLVSRDVVRVITPGMIIENELLDEKSNNYVLALAREHQTLGLAYLDISTGAFRLCQSQDHPAVMDEILRTAPREILFAESAKNDPVLSPMVKQLAGSATGFLPDRSFDPAQARERLLDQFKTISLEGFGIEELRAGVAAAGALLFYVRETQKQKIEHLAKIEPYALDNALLVDDLSCRNLELVKNLRTGSRQATLLGVIDRTITAMGGRLLYRWLRYPLIDIPEIELRLNAVQEAKATSRSRKAIRECLKSVSDLERLSSKISMGHCNARDLVALKRSLKIVPEVWSHLAPLRSELFQHAQDTVLEDIAQLIEVAIREDAPLTINEGGIIKSGYNAELDDLIQISRDGKGWLAKLEAREKKATGISTLKVRYNKVFGYYIEVSKGQAKDVPERYVRRQTLVNAERYITDELKTFESKVLSAEERRAALEYDIFVRVKQEITKSNQHILQTASFLARLDCLLSLAEVADRQDYTRPTLTTDGCILIEQGRHPVVEKMITAERFVPNTIRMDNEENQILIITGPNMAGKSTVLRQVAILVIMAHMGSFVPAARAAVSITDRIFTRVGALDNLSQGQSTFMVEMQETANILNNATPQSLVIMDEIGRGTSTFDGLSIAWAVAEFLHDQQHRGVKTLFATHYHELTDLALTKPRVRNYNIAVKEWNDEIIFLRQLVAGGTNRSYGIQVARLAGIPQNVVSRAKKILANIENGEFSFNGLPTAVRGEAVANKGQVQLSLFRKPEQFVIEKLQQIDISRMTPMDAINCLNDLQQKAKAVNG